MFFVENLPTHGSLPGWSSFLAFDQLVRCWMRMKLFQDVLLCSVTLRNMLSPRPFDVSHGLLQMCLLIMTR